MERQPEYPPEYDDPAYDEPPTLAERWRAIRQRRAVSIDRGGWACTLAWRPFAFTVTAGTTYDASDPYPRWYAGAHTARGLTSRVWSAWLGRRRWTVHTSRRR